MSQSADVVKPADSVGKLGADARVTIMAQNICILDKHPLAYESVPEIMKITTFLLA